MNELATIEILNYGNLLRNLLSVLSLKSISPKEIIIVAPFYLARPASRASFATLAALAFG